MFDLNEIVNFEEINQLIDNNFLTLDNNQIGGNVVYNLVRTNTKTNKNFDIRQTSFHYKINNNIAQKSLFEAEQNFKNFINDFTSAHIDPLDNNSKIKIYISHPTFDLPINTNYIQKSQFVPDIIQKLFFNVVQSRKRANKLQFTDADQMELILTVANTINGAGRKRKVPIEEIICTNFVSFKKVKTLREHCRSMPCVIPCDDDNYCLVRSILLGKLFHENHEEFKKRSIPHDILFTKQVKTFATKLNLPDQPYGLDLGHAAKIENDVGYQIIIYQDGIKSNPPVYWNRDKQDLKKIYILYNSVEHHFSLIKHIRAFFGNNYFCEQCMKIYYKVNSHKCPATCQSCYRMNCEHERQDKCACKATIKNDKCMFYHNQVCKIARKCPTCTNIISINRKHICLNQKFCSNCNEAVPMNHMCFIKKLDQESKVRFKGLGFFDFEAYELEDGTHCVNLAMAKRVCKNCYDNKSCRLCNHKYKFDNIADFVAWLKADSNKDFIWYAHNAKGYDTQFILNELYNNTLPTDSKINVITNGSKIMELRYGNFIIRDSACFIPMPLSQFPKAFNIHELKKGYFPHKFNQPKNWEYIGPYPDACFYQPEFMTAEKKLDFESFYNAVTSRGHVFNFKQEFEDYCWSDVVLLAEGCMRFSRLSRDSSKMNAADRGFDPLVNCLTLASACNALYRRNFMPKDTIATLPACGYNPKANLSKACELWLKYFSESNNIESKFFLFWILSHFIIFCFYSKACKKRR